jgi:Mg-chelatase subunit ChlD
MTRTRHASATLISLVALVAGCASAAPTPPPASPAGADGAPGVAMAEKASAPRDDVAPAASVAPAAAPEPPPAPMPAVASAPARAGAAHAPRPSSAPREEAPKKLAADAAPPPPPPPAAVAVAPTPSVKAGEWDDNANYREFQKWLGTESSQPYHRVDVRDRQFIVVRDADGKPMPRCAVDVRDEQGHHASLTTTASGRTLLFPHAEGLAGNDLVATTRCQGGLATARLSLAQSDGVVDLKLGVKRQLPTTRDIDIAFILDTTGSMAEEIAAVKSTLQKVASQLSTANARVRIGLVEYKDRTDDFVTKVYPMSTDIHAFSQKVASISAAGGGDTPESMNEGLHVGLNGLKWSDTAVAKFAFLIADAPPHLDYANDFDYARDMRDAAHRGIQVFTVAASGMDDLGQVVFRQIAQYTGATNMFVLRGGAGPQSTGAGDPKSSCGGTQTQFASGNLDALIIGKIKRELVLLDRDPLKIPGVRVDENAKPCAERLMVAM